MKPKDWKYAFDFESKEEGSASANLSTFVKASPYVELDDLRLVRDQGTEK